MLKQKDRPPAMLI